MPKNTLCGTIIEDDEYIPCEMTCAKCGIEFDAWNGDGYYNTIEDEWYCSDGCMREHLGIVRSDIEAERMEQEGID